MQHSSIARSQWFDLSHYSSLSSWGEIDWFRAISCRQGVATWIKHKLPGVEDAMDLVAEHFLKLAGNPICPAGMEAIETDRTALLDEGRIAYVRPVLGIEPAELAETWAEHWADVREDYRLAMVDLKGSDADIIDAFGAWLKEARGGSGRVGGVTQADMQQWTKHRVLPYIDLTLYAEATGLSMTQVQIADVLFPDDVEVDHVERLRKSTKKYATRLMSDDLRRQLAGQVGMLGG